MSDPTHEFPVFTELVDFLVHAPSYREIIAFQVSAETQERLESLLDANREGVLSPLEQAELDAYQQVDHLMILLKVRARQALAATR